MANESLRRLKKFQLFKSAPPADPKLIRYLSKQPLFKGAPEEVLAKIAGQVKTHRLAKDDVLLRKGAPSESLFIIRTGWLKVTTSDTHGEEVVLNHLGPGQVLGEMSLLDRSPRSSTAVVLRDAEIIEIAYDLILEVMEQHPVLAQSLLQEMFNRVRFANAYVEEAVEWFRHIAAGNYDFVQGQIEQSQSTVVDMSKPDHARASAFLSVFFKMIEDVKTRELQLKQQVHHLTIQIDEAKRQKAVQELTDTEFFEGLQEAAQRVRQERESRLKQQSQSDSSAAD